MSSPWNDFFHAHTSVTAMQVSAYYDYVAGLDSDDDLGLVGSDGSEGSSSGRER